MAVALSARSIDAKLPPAGGRREEDDALGVARDLREGAHELCLAAPARPGGRHRRPHPLVELRPEGLDELALLVGDLGVALGEEHLAVTRFHAQQLHDQRL